MGTGESWKVFTRVRRGGPTRGSFLVNLPWKQLTGQTAGENVSVYLCVVSWDECVCACVHMLV